MNDLKHKVYILMTLVLTNVFAFLVHAVVEVVYINALINNFQVYSFGLSWGAWFLIHDIATVLLHILATVAGYELGQRWWQIVYVERRHWFLRRTP